MAERSYPASEIGGVAERRYPASEVRGSGREELPHAPKPEARGEGWTGYPMPSCPRPGVEARRSNPMPETRGGGREDQPHIQGAMAAWVQEGLEELSHIEDQEGHR